MAQPIKRELKAINKRVEKEASKRPRQQKKKRIHADYGTSKLEEKFAKEFLDKLKVRYVYQFKAESIGRWFDFYLPDHLMLIEVDGCYWHSKGVDYENMTPTQKRNKRVDEQKDHWARINCYRLLRIWEDDINNRPSEVMKRLKMFLGVAEEKKKIIDDKKRRH